MFVLSLPSLTPTRVRAREDVREGRLEGALIIPPQFSRRFYAGENPQLGMVVDNSDQFMESSLQSKMQELVDSLNQPAASAQRITNEVALEMIELYPYVEYLKYLLPGSITLAMFVSVMIGGGCCTSMTRLVVSTRAIWSLPSPDWRWCWGSISPEPSRR